MKCTWEEGDIRPGRRYSMYGIEEIWTIGFLSYTEDKDRYVSISNQDGMVTKPLTKTQLATELTNAGYLPIELLDKP